MKKEKKTISTLKENLFFVLQILILVLLWVVIISWLVFKKILIAPGLSQKKVRFYRGKFWKCPRCEEMLFVQANRAKEWIDDWDSDCLVCFNEKCPIYGKSIIMVYESFSHRPYTRLPEDKDPIIYKRGDSDVVIVDK